MLIYPEVEVNLDIDKVIRQAKTGATRLAFAYRCSMIPIGVKDALKIKDSAFDKFKEIFVSRLAI